MLIQPHHARWKDDFHQISLLLKAPLQEAIIGIEHVGSTAVPGLAAKPIIDIDLIYAPDQAFEEIKSRLAEIGYYHNGDQGIPKREVFKRIPTDKPHPLLDHIRHHLYACPQDSEELHRHLSFRDHLISNPKARATYQALKYRLAEEAQQDQKTYASLKEEQAKTFILSIIAQHNQ